MESGTFREEELVLVRRPVTPTPDLKIGDEVVLLSGSPVGEVISCYKDESLVSFDDELFWLPMSCLEKL